MENKPKPKVKFPKAWNLTDKKFVVEHIKKFNSAEIARIAQAQGLTNITKRRVAEFLTNYEGALILRAHMRSGLERTSINSKKKVGQPTTPSGRKGLYLHHRNLKKSREII